ncbi:MAG: SGNH/GDSL hydrolase family protein [Sinobacteraceae bacterium]|nr:SGNH/GDSL hydrolase family protein [Nevskiaceae bacterium]
MPASAQNILDAAASKIQTVVDGLVAWWRGDENTVVNNGSVNLPTLAALVKSVQDKTGAVDSVQTIIAAAMAAAQTAQSAASAALASGHVYADTASGMAATASGNGFFVAPSSRAGGLIDVYLNASGTPQLIGTIAALNTVVVPVPAEAAGLPLQFVDANGRTAGGITADGSWAPRKLVLPAGSVSRAALAADAQAGFVPDGVSQFLGLTPEESSTLWAIVDQIGRMAVWVDASGGISLPKAILGAAARLADRVDLSLKDRVFGDALAGLFSSLAPETGYSLAIVDQNGRLVLGIPQNGTIAARVSRALVVQTDAGYRANANYVVRTTLDAQGNRQLISFRLSDGQGTALTTNGDNYEPELTADDAVLFHHAEGGSVTDLWVPAAGGAINPVRYTSIDAWGDSLTAGYGATGNGGPYPYRLGLLVGKSIGNYGIGGQTSTQIAARQGGAPALVTVSGGAIPASGGVSVTLTVDVLYHTTGQTLDGTIAGVHGTLSRDPSSGNYTFTRSTSGSSVAVAQNTPFIPDLGVGSRNSLQLLWLGRNNLTGTQQIQTDVAACVGYLTTYVKSYVVMGVLNSAREIPNTTNYQYIVAVNQTLSNTYGPRFVDIRVPPTAAEMAALNYTPTADDQTDINNDAIPRGMRFNQDPSDVHLNDIGYQLVANRLFKLLTDRGYLL